MRCRPACARDAARLADIYAPYVADTAITFATAMPTEGEFAEKIARIGATFPFLVCEEEGRVLGYAYAATYRVREAYRWDVELSIYVDTSCRGRGVGKALMERLLRCLRAQGYQNADRAVSTGGVQAGKMARRGVAAPALRGFPRKPCGTHALLRPCAGEARRADGMIA